MMRKRLGELLIEAGLIDEYQLQSALGHQRQWGGRLGQILVHMKLVVEDRMVRVLSTQLGVPVADTPADDLHVRVLGEVSLELVLQHHVFPLAIRRDAKGDQLALAMTDPTNVAAIDAVQFTTGKKVVPFLAGDSAIESWIRRHYQGERVVQPSGLAATVDEASAQMGVQFGGQLVDLGAAAASDDDDIPVVTGAMVAAPPPSAVPDPFAGLAPMSAPSSTVPSARFAAIVPGVATSIGFAGTGLATLDPVIGDAAGAWDKHVEQAATQPVAPTPSFGPAGGFLGADDDEAPAAAAAPPAADPFAALAPTPVEPMPVAAAPATPAPDVDEAAFDLSEPVLDLADLAEPVTPVPVAPPAPAMAASIAAPAAPSWGDLLDAPPAFVTAPSAAAPAWAESTPLAAPVDVAVPPAAVEAGRDDNPFARVPITADAFAPVVEPAHAEPAIVKQPAVDVATVADTQTCPRCSNVRVDAARFCPFCGLSFVDVPVSPVVEHAVQGFAASDETPIDLDINEPSGPIPMAPPPAIDVDVDAVDKAPAFAANPAGDIDVGLASVDDAPVPAEPAIDIDIGLAPVDDAPAATAVAEIDDEPAVDIDMGFTSAEAPAVDIDIGLAPVDEPPLVIEVPAADIGFDAAADDTAAPADGIDIGLAPIDEPPLVAEVAAADIGLAPADDGAAPLALQWADAAEQIIPRKESDRRNDVGWVPPSREIVVTPPPAAPVPEPIIAYTPAAPAIPVPVPAAPWAVFAPTSAVVEEPVAAPEPPAPVAADAWVVPPSSARLDDATPSFVDDAAATIDDDAIALRGAPAAPSVELEPAAVEASVDVVEPASVEAVDAPEDVDAFEAVDAVDVVDVPEAAVAESPAAEAPAVDVDVDVPVVDAAFAEPLALPDDALVALPAAPEELGLEIDINEPSGPMTPSPGHPLQGAGPSDPGPAADVAASVEPLEIDDLELLDLPPEPATASATNPSTTTMPPAAEPPPLSTLVGWGDLIDAPPTFQPPAVLPHISVPSFMPPATLTPPPMALHRTPTLDKIVAPPALSAPLVPPSLSWPPATNDDPFAALPDLELPTSLPQAPTPRPQRVTATMVMKLDPAEQKRLLEMLLAKTEINADVLSTPPGPADGDPDKGT